MDSEPAAVALPDESVPVAPPAPAVERRKSSTASLTEKKSLITETGGEGKEGRRGTRHGD